MAGVTSKTLRRLLPDGQAFKGGANLDAVIEALGLSLDRAHDFLGGVQAEAIPETAEQTIDEWLVALGLSVPEGTSLGDKRNIASATYSAIGGQSLDYINEKIRTVFPNIYIDETETTEAGTAAFTLYYYVRGYVPMARDFQRLFAMIMRIAPLHLVPVYQARSVYDSDVGRCGIGSVGRMVVGRKTTSYTETQGELARCGQGRVGMQITGRTS